MNTRIMFGVDSLRCQPVGSRVTCNPQPIGTDEDWLLLVADGEVFLKQAANNGFILDGSLNGGDVATNASSVSDGLFISVSRDDRFNLIATTDVAFFEKFIFGTRIAKALNLLNKTDRIILFQAILYGHFED